MNLETAPPEEVLRWLLAGNPLSAFAEDARLFGGSSVIRCAIRREDYETLKKRFIDDHADNS